MVPIFFKRITLFLLLTTSLLTVNAQSQEDFNTRLSDVYTNAADKKKALTIATELYNMVEKKKDLQTYANYYLLKNIFENQAEDKILAKACDEKATKAMNAMVGLATTNTADTTNNPFNQWYLNTEKFPHVEIVPILLDAGEKVYSWKLVDIEVPVRQKKRIQCCKNCNEMFVQHDNELLCGACTE